MNEPERVKLGSLTFNTIYNFNKLERQVFCKKAKLYSGQPRILTILQGSEGCTLKELSAISHIGMPSLSVSVRNMEKTGLVYKGSGLRNQQIFLTDDGRARARLFHEEIDAFYLSFYDTLGDAQAKVLFSALSAFNDFIEAYIKEKQPGGQDTEQDAGQE